MVDRCGHVSLHDQGRGGRGRIRARLKGRPGRWAPVGSPEPRAAPRSRAAELTAPDVRGAATDRFGLPISGPLCVHVDRPGDTEVFAAWQGREILRAFPWPLQAEASAVSTMARHVTRGAACAPIPLWSTGSSPIQIAGPGWAALASNVANPPAENPISPTRGVDALAPVLAGAEIGAQVGDETAVAGVVGPCRQIRYGGHEARLGQMLAPTGHVVAAPREPVGHDHQGRGRDVLRPEDIHVSGACGEFHARVCSAGLAADGRAGTAAARRSVIAVDPVMVTGSVRWFCFTAGVPVRILADYITSYASARGEFAGISKGSSRPC